MPSSPFFITLLFLFALEHLTFWEHLDVLRGCFLRILGAVFVAALVAFYFRQWLFSFVLAPLSPNFVTFRCLASFAGPLPEYHPHLINTELTQQLLVHIKVALCFGLFAVSPYILFVLFRFVAPALYAAERRYALRAVLSGYIMFFFGAALSYFVIFPLTFRFLAAYQVDASVPNFISLSSYISTFLLLALLMGLVFQLPVLSWVLARLGFLRPSFMTHYRRHAVVAILIVAAVITPTADAFTLAVVALPIYLLYELSILVVRRASRGADTAPANPV